MRAKDRVLQIIFWIMLAVFVVLTVCCASNCKGRSLADAEYDRTVPFAEGWHTADGTVLDEKMLQKINSISSDREMSIYNTLPVDPVNADALYFRAKNIFYSVYIDGEEIYTPQFSDSIFYPDSSGTRWTSIDLTPEHLGKEIEIRFTAAYPKSRCGIEYLRIGSSGGIVLNILKEKIISLITCVLLLFVGILLVVADIPINMRSKKNHELLFLGLFSICVSVWCFAELHILELFFDDSRLTLT